jgi:hypothetical protein
MMVVLVTQLTAKPYNKTMNVTKLASKKLQQLFGRTDLNKFEYLFKNLILYDNILKTNGGVLCNMRLVKLICERAREYDVEILGVETSMDCDIPLKFFVWEDYSHLEQSPEWVVIAMEDFFKQYPATLLFFTISIPEKRLAELSKMTGLEY